MLTKICKNCKLRKPIIEFRFDSRSVCNECNPRPIKEEKIYSPTFMQNVSLEAMEEQIIQGIKRMAPIYEQRILARKEEETQRIKEINKKKVETLKDYYIADNLGLSIEQLREYPLLIKLKKLEILNKRKFKKYDSENK